MIPIFQTKATVVRPVMISSRWGYVQRTLQSIYQRAVTYRQENWLASIPRNEFLMKLVLNYPLEFALPIDEFYYQAYWAGLGFSQTMGMTSSLSPGKSHYAHFLGSRSVEFYLATFESFDYKLAEENWQDLTPVTYLMHPRSSLAAAPECDQSGEDGLAVLAINMPMLAVQLRGFIQQARGKDQDNALFSSFIDQYVLPKTIPSQAEIALFNQIAYQHDDQLIFRSTQTASTPYPNVNVDKDVRYIVGESIKAFALTDWLFDSMLQSMPSIYAHNARTSLMLPNVQVSPNSMWLLLVARLRVYDLMLRVGGEVAQRANQAEINRLNRTLSVYNVQRQVQRLIPQPEQSAVLGMIARLKALI